MVCPLKNILFFFFTNIKYGYFFQYPYLLFVKKKILVYFLLFLTFLIILLLGVFFVFFLIFCHVAAVAHTFPCLWDIKGLLITQNICQIIWSCLWSSNWFTYKRNIIMRTLRQWRREVCIPATFSERQLDPQWRTSMGWSSFWRDKDIFIKTKWCDDPFRHRLFLLNIWKCDHH